MGKRGGNWQGNFGSYAGSSIKGDYPDDEEAVSAAVDEMFSNCGNAGQESIIGEGASDFEDWANAALEEDSADNTLEDFMTLVLSWLGGRQDKLNATDQIWQTGYEAIADQSAYHDKADEKGEGKGSEFG